MVLVLMLLSIFDKEHKKQHPTLPHLLSSPLSLLPNSKKPEQIFETWANNTHPDAGVFLFSCISKFCFTDCRNSLSQRIFEGVMGFSVLGVCVGGFVLFFLGGIKVEFSQSESFARNYISWDDLKVDDRKLGLNTKEERVNRSRIIVVDKNGGGDSLTVQGAVDMVPEQNTERVKIYILPGIYREKVLVPISKPYISFIGNQKKTSETVITWNNKASDKDGTGCELGTYRTASVAIEADYFCATGITFENTVVPVPGGYGMQAVALRVAGDKAMFYRVQVLGTQDTLLDETGSHYFYHCHIKGNVDFIFGRSRTLYQCVIQSTAENSGAIAAHHRDSPYEDTGFSFVNCKIIGTGYIYLGRAWGNYSRAVYSYCHFDDIITPPGWSDWNYPSRQKTVDFGEYECRGRGAERSGRVPWLKSFSLEEIRPFLDTKFISGEQWLRL